MKIKKAAAEYSLQSGDISGENVLRSKKLLSQLGGVFKDAAAFKVMDGDTVVYEVTSHAEEKDGASGGLFFGTSRIHPGKVGDEYFMTKGHFHRKREAAEYYFGISGGGILLLTDESGESRAEKVERGSLHYIKGNTAHRLINTGKDDLVVGACWPSDAGHDYLSIEESGFKVRAVCINGEAVLIPDEK